MRKTGILYNERYLGHDTGRGHPERAERLNSIYIELKSQGMLSSLTSLEERECPIEWIEKIHTSKYIKRVEKEIKSGIRYLDSMDTGVCPKSYGIALYAAGGGLSAVDAVMNGQIDNAFLCVRPPGHHAESSRAMGFCIFNNAAIAARYIQEKYNLKKIVILDWDVHHGNGTQHTFYSDPSVFYISTHQSPHYPGTGRKNETGSGQGKGYTLNIPMSAGKNDDDYLKAFDNEIIPAMNDFAPDFILISAGYDAHTRDPLSGMRLSSKVFGDFTQKILSVADKHSNGRVVAFLEGGYDLKGLSESVAETVKAMHM